MAIMHAKEYKSFEKIKQVDDNGNEFWYARDLANILQYAQWRNFQKVIDRAMVACKNSGLLVEEQFAEFSKLFEVGR